MSTYYRVHNQEEDWTRLTLKNGLHRVSTGDLQYLRQCRTDINLREICTRQLTDPQNDVIRLSYVLHIWCDLYHLTQVILEIQPLKSVEHDENQQKQRPCLAMHCEYILQWQMGSEAMLGNRFLLITEKRFGPKIFLIFDIEIKLREPLTFQLSFSSPMCFMSSRRRRTAQLRVNRDWASSSTEAQSTERDSELSASQRLSAGFTATRKTSQPSETEYAIEAPKLRP